MSFRLCLSSAVFLLMFSMNASLWACENCVIPNLGRHDAGVVAHSEDKKWYFKYLFEQQDWKKISAEEAHDLHHDGHHVHAKTREDFHHFSLGGHLTETVSMNVHLPYVIKYSLETHSHARLGRQERSEGFGDINAVAEYNLLKSDSGSFSFTGGVKFPTGETDERNSGNSLFDVELQPGSGSFDYVLGGIARQEQGRLKWLGNLAYVFKNEGKRDYTYGDLLSASVFADYVLNPDSERFQTEAGIHCNLQYEQKHEEAGDSIADSGGTTVLLGPAFTVRANDLVSVFASILFPVYQNLGGVHQELDLTWTAGGRLAF